MVLAQKQTYRSTEQITEPRNEHTLKCTINLQQRWQEYKIGERQSLQ